MVHQGVEQRLRQVLLVEEITSQDDSSSDIDQVTRRTKKMLKSGMDHMGATCILLKKCINWTHEMLYSADGKAAIYNDLTLVAFVCTGLKSYRWWAGLHFYPSLPFLDTRQTR